MKTLPLQSPHYLYLLQSFEQWLHIIGYSESAIKNWPVHVRELLHFLESRHIHHITLVDNEHINQFIGYVKHRVNTTREGALSSSSINNIINAINSFTRYLNTTGKFMLDYTVERAEDDVKLPAVLSIQEIKSLYDATFLPHRENSLALGQRDRAIIAIFCGCGLRKMEGTNLNLNDIDLDRKQVFVRRGKGGKQRYVDSLAAHVPGTGPWLNVSLPPVFNVFGAFLSIIRFITASGFMPVCTAVALLRRLEKVDQEQ
jgi:site-specific recombinase XerD